MKISAWREQEQSTVNEANASLFPEGLQQYLSSLR
jgi:hypothetical protein